MRHRKKGRKLNRTASHKKAMLRNLANQLFEYKEIRTTTAKAKEARPTVERLITYAKKGNLHHRRLAFSFLRQKSAIKTLFDEIGPTFSDRQGGYTRVIKLGRRLGDGAPMSILQLVGFEALGDTVKKETKKRTKNKEVASDEQVTSVEETVEATAAIADEKMTADSNKDDEVKSEIADPIDKKAEEAEPEVTKKEESAQKVGDVETEKPDENDKPEVPDKEANADEPDKQKTDK